MPIPTRLTPSPPPPTTNEPNEPVEVDEPLTFPLNSALPVV